MITPVSLVGESGFVNLKCDPKWALELRALHKAVRPGYHANKRHWNNVDLDGSIEDDELREMIDHSYELVV
jgi:predicted DNA-binding protein (MmcQ/YjbR family)